jgi:hypothetical protein
MEEEHISNSDDECDVPEPHYEPEPEPEPEPELEEYEPAADAYAAKPYIVLPLVNPSGILPGGKPKELSQVLNQISTEGVPYPEVGDVDLFAVKDLVRQCSFCNKFYKHDMIAPNGKPGDYQCWHCLFWMNHDVNARKNVDGVFGMTIADYVLKCKDVHELDACTRNTDSGGCFLCEYNLGLPITDIKDSSKLSRSFEVPDRPLDDDKVDLSDMQHLYTQYDEEEMTITI